jgi:hypothetical protein
MSKDLPNISVGDFAMDILNDMAKNPAKALKPSLKESTTQGLNVPDISNVEVGDDFVSLVTEGKKVNNKVKPQPVKESVEHRMESVVDRLAKLITEARQLIEEMSCGATTTGNIGVNMAGRGLKVKKKKLAYNVPNKVSEEQEVNPWAICNSSVGKSKSAKFERCVQKIKSKHGIR